MIVDFDFREVDKLATDLGTAIPKVKAASSKALTVVAAKLRDDARSAAPVDTGALRDSITIRGGNDYRIVGSELRYAGFVEFGTSDTAPQPFVWPQATTAQERLADLLELVADPLT